NREICQQGEYIKETQVIWNVDMTLFFVNV
ncbi:unnamed protein product, partial [marine sediment metagenome]